MEDQQQRQRAQQHQQEQQHQQQKDLFAFFSSPQDHPSPNSSSNSQSNANINQHASAPMPIPGISMPMSMPLFPFAPASPPSALSTSPVTMSMLTNLMQNIQGIDNQPSSSSNTPQNASSQSQQTPYSPQMILEHQFKITQLQQLQQLQNQIFQQQIALISGQSPTLLPGSPSVSMEGASSSQRGEQGSFTGLPTPGPSTEIRPSQPTSMDFVSPMVLSNSFLDPHASSSNLHQHSQSSHSHSHSHSQSHPFREHTFSSPIMEHPMTSHQSNHGRNHHHAHFDMPHSAPEHIAFRTSPGRELDIDISPLTSPWLGAHSSSSTFHTQQAQAHLQPPRTGARSKRPPSSSGDESSAPSRKKQQSPAIRAQNPTPSTSSSSSVRGRRLSKSTTSTPLLRSTRGNTGREFTSIGEVVGDTPSPVDLSMPPPAPPTQQLTLPPITTNTSNLGYATPMSAGGSSSNAPNRTNHSSASSSASDGAIPNTPVSPAFGPSDASYPTNTGDSGQYDAQMDAAFQDTSSPAFGASSPVFGATTPSNAFMGTSSPAFGSSSPTFSPGTFTGDTSFSQHGTQGMGGVTPAPATPASMMNLGRLGTSSSLMPPQGRTTVEKAKTRSATATASGKGKKGSVGASPGLKAILPAGPTTPSQFSDPSPLPGPVLAIKKTSHKHAEQKRRDSLKSTFDDLRHLLPPIPLPSEPDTPILPGALPPRGPPKAGAEGPNKAVSKLQLLICGNEYIRTLKGRVDRRDDEIQKLRREVGRLRGEVGKLKGIAGEQFEEENTEGEDGIDLEKDLDAVEALRPSFGRLGMSGGQDDDDGDD